MARYYEGSLVSPPGRFAICVSRFNSFITDALLSGALDALKRHGVEEDDIDVYRVPGTFELVLANVLTPVLRELRDALCARARGGILILSGFKRADRDELIASYRSAGMPLQSELERDGWFAALLRARPPR